MSDPKAKDGRVPLASFHADAMCTDVGQHSIVVGMSVSRGSVVGSVRDLAWDPALRAVTFKVVPNEALGEGRLREFILIGGGTGQLLEASKEKT